MLTCVLVSPNFAQVGLAFVYASACVRVMCSACTVLVWHCECCLSAGMLTLLLTHAPCAQVQNILPTHGFALGTLTKLGKDHMDYQAGKSGQGESLCSFVSLFHAQH